MIKIQNSQEGDISVTDKSNYESLLAVLMEAYEQAACGKGQDRHGNGLPFEKQPMQAISDLLDNSDFMAGQAIKKIIESRGLPSIERKKSELLGSICYIAGIVIFLEKGVEKKHRESGGNSSR